MTETLLRPFTTRDIDWLVEEHSVHYAAAEGFDASFPQLVRAILEDIVATGEPATQRGWIAEDRGKPLGSIFCVPSGETGSAKLRLFYVTSAARGQGVGRSLIKSCISFARAAGYRDIVLWTHESQRTAGAVYASSGFALIESRPARNFGVDAIEQTWILTF